MLNFRNNMVIWADVGAVPALSVEPSSSQTKDQAIEHLDFSSLSMGHRK